MGVAEELTEHEPFAGCERADLQRLARLLVVARHAPGAALFREGEPGTTFAVVLEGTVAIDHDTAGGRAVAHAGPGSILGELAMLTGRLRVATVTALTPVRAAVGDHRAFDAMLRLPHVSRQLAAMVGQRLAEDATVVPVTLRDGIPIGLRPLVPSDREEYVGLIGRQSEAWRYSRFFGFGQPTARTIDHLVDINYVDHFAWVALESGGDRHAAVGRYTRTEDDPATAEVAFGVAALHQGRGIATVLLGALAVTAATAGITRFTAQTLWGNHAMRAVFEKAGARWATVDTGIAGTTFDAAAAARLIDGDFAARLVRTARDIATGAGLALVVPADRPGRQS